MLTKSEKFGTVLTVGPRLKRFIEMGYAHRLLWSEDYPDQEEKTPDGRGEFQKTREWIETAPLDEVFDLWLRGQNLSGFSEILLRAVPVFTKVCGKKVSA